MDLSQEERIAARRARVEERLATRRKSNDNAESGTTASLLRSTAELAESQHGGGGQKIVSGEQRAREAHIEMAAARSGAEDAVTQFAVKSNAEEQERRTRVEAMAETRRERRAREMEENAARLGALNLRFEALYSYTVPHELHAAIEAQRKQCGELLAVKEKLINELHTQLEDKENAYVETLRRNAQEIDELVRAMHEKADEYADRYTSELAAVEQNYEQEREAFVGRCIADIQQLVRTRRAKEADYRRRRENKIVEGQAELEAKHEEAYEDYNETRNQYQTDIHTLRQELEKCKADFMLNGERLSYNLQVLRERVKENRNAQNQYKRKLAKLQDTLSSLIARHQDSERRYRRSNKDLTVQLHRVGTQYKDLQQKFQLFEKADKDKYRQLWNTHDQRCRKLVHRSLQADRVVFEDVLSMPWTPPEMAFWPDEQEDLHGLGQSDSHDGGTSSDEAGDGEDDKTRTELELKEPELMLLQILRNQAPFLVDDNIYAAIRQVEGTTEEQATVEGILGTLKIQTNDDMQDLLEYFMVETQDGVRALINPQEALRALNAFLEERKARQVKDGERLALLSDRNRQQAKMTHRERHKAAERNYWRQLAQAVPETHLQIWNALEKGLEQYLSQLQQRRALIGTTDTLRARNNELKELLAQYMHSDINFELHTAPRLLGATQTR